MTGKSDRGRVKKPVSLKPALKPVDVDKLVQRAVGELQRFESQWRARSEFDNEVALTLQKNRLYLEKLLKLRIQGVSDVIRPLQNTALAILELIETLARPVSDSEPIRRPKSSVDKRLKQKKAAERPAKQKAEKTGVDPLAQHLLSVFVSDQPAPLSLEQAVENVWPAWRTLRSIPRPQGPGKMEMVTIADDLARGESSRLWTSTGRLVNLLIKADKVPNEATARVRKLHDAIVKYHKIDEVAQTVLSWGINVL